MKNTPESVLEKRQNSPGKSAGGIGQQKGAGTRIGRDYSPGGKNHTDISRNKLERGGGEQLQLPLNHGFRFTLQIYTIKSDLN